LDLKFNFRLMRQDDLDSLIQQLLPIALMAGEAIMSVYVNDRVNDVEYKEDSSPVTKADLLAHHILAVRLKSLLPCCPVVSEEDLASQIYRQSKGRFWLIDPLDGTKEFIARNGEFTVNIALIEDGRSILGVVYAPAIDALYWGGSEFGSFRRVLSEMVSLNMSAAREGDCCRVVASKSHLNGLTQSFIDRLGVASLVQAGSSLKFCRVAEGEADIYPRLAPTCEWDTAAAQAVLEGAGGVVQDLDGQPLRYGKLDVLNPSFIAASNADLIPHD
jgi:3'(2'), 5'-bisphosphate nucleotidase